jgi:FMN phosphatase YigB (HAD superfamily)
LIERGEAELNDSWFVAFCKQLSRESVWKSYWTKNSIRKNAGGVPAAAVEKAPPVPHIDAKKLFWRMMRLSRTPDPYMYPALRKLKESGKFVLGALSNTVHFPTGILDDEGVLFDKSLIHDQRVDNPYAADSTDIRDCFDTYISSAHVGVRKPDKRAYELAVRELNSIAEKRGGSKVRAGDVLFLDDIGINLKFAKKSGLRTIKVELGKTRDAVSELERETGLDLGGGGGGGGGKSKL